MNGIFLSPIFLSFMNSFATAATVDELGRETPTSLAGPYESRNDDC